MLATLLCVAALALAAQAQCPRPARISGSRCLCRDPNPFCTGPGCVRGQSKRGNALELFPLTCTLCSCVAMRPKIGDTEPPHVVLYPNNDNARALGKGAKEQILFVTVATHREPYIDLLEQSTMNLGIELEILGLGEFFKGAPQFSAAFPDFRF